MIGLRGMACHCLISLFDNACLLLCFNRLFGRLGGWPTHATLLVHSRPCTWLVDDLRVNGRLAMLVKLEGLFWPENVHASLHHLHPLILWLPSISPDEGRSMLDLPCWPESRDALTQAPACGSPPSGFPQSALLCVGQC